MVKAKTINHHRENHKTNKQNKLSDPCPLWPTWVWQFFLLCFRWFLIVFVLTSLVDLVSLVFPMVFNISKCRFDSPKGLRCGCAPSLNKVFTLHEFPYIRKRLPCTIDFPLQVIPPFIYEVFPLYKGFPFMRDFLVQGISIYLGFVGVVFSKTFHFTKVSTCKGFPCIRDFPL